MGISELKYTKKNFVSSQLFTLEIYAKIQILNRFRVEIGQCMMHYSYFCGP